MARKYQKKQEKIEEVQNKIKVLERELSENEQISGDLAKRKKILQSNLVKQKHTLDQLIPKELKISDHAILRYLERKKKLDIEKIKEEIKNELEGLNLKDVNAYGFVVRNNVVATYVGGEENE